MKTLSALLLGLVLTLGLAFAQDTGGATGGSTGGSETGGMSSMDDSTGGSSTGGATGGSETGGASGQSIADIVSGDSQFSTLLDALSAAGLAEEFSSGGPYTVFAPTNEAFSALPSSELDAILGDLDQLANLLQNHVVSGAYTAEEITGFPEVLMLNGQTLSISTSGGSATIGDATITSTDIQASNGVIHVIDTVLLPSGAGGQTGGSSTGGSDTGGHDGRQCNGRQRQRQRLNTGSFLEEAYVGLVQRTLLH